MSLFIVDKIEHTEHRKLFTIMGVDYRATSKAWIGFPLMITLGIVIAFIVAPVEQPLSKLWIGVGYGILIFLANFCHALGHIISSRMVSAPMQTLILTSTVHLTLYDDTQDYPSRVHVGRAIGGPAFNFIVGLISIALYNFVVSNHFILFFGVVNLLLTVITLLPIPSVDGPVILRELRHWKT